MTDNELFERTVISHVGHFMDVQTCAHDADDRLSQAMDVEIILVEFGCLIASGVKLFDNLRKINPESRILLALEGLTVTLAIELIKCGVTDLIEIPIQPKVLAAKLKRVLVEKPQPVIPIPGLTEAVPSENRRNSYRAEITGTLPAQVTIRNHSWEVMAHGQVMDLSLAAGSWRGGLSFTVSPQDEAQLASLGWPTGYAFQMEIKLATEIKPIPVSANMVRVSPLDGGSALVAVQYDLKYSDDLARLRRYWVALQRERNRLRSLAEEEREFGPPKKQSSH
jgi:DNA-binding response OmpR family regulator